MKRQDQVAIKRIETSRTSPTPLTLFKTLAFILTTSLVAVQIFHLPLPPRHREQRTVPANTGFATTASTPSHHGVSKGKIAARPISVRSQTNGDTGDPAANVPPATHAAPSALAASNDETLWGGGNTGYPAIENSDDRDARTKAAQAEDDVKRLRELIAESLRLARGENLFRFFKTWREEQGRLAQLGFNLSQLQGQITNVARVANNAAGARALNPQRYNSAIAQLNTLKAQLPAAERNVQMQTARVAAASKNVFPDLENWLNNYVKMRLLIPENRQHAARNGLTHELQNACENNPRFAEGMVLLATLLAFGDENDRRRSHDLLEKANGIYTQYLLYDTTVTLQHWDLVSGDVCRVAITLQDAAFAKSFTTEIDKLPANLKTSYRRWLLGGHALLEGKIGLAKQELRRTAAREGLFKPENEVVPQPLEPLAGVLAYAWLCENPSPNDAQSASELLAKVDPATTSWRCLRAKAELNLYNEQWELAIGNLSKAIERAPLCICESLDEKLAEARKADAKRAGANLPIPENGSSP